MICRGWTVWNWLTSSFGSKPPAGEESPRLLPLCDVTATRGLLTTRIAHGRASKQFLAPCQLGTVLRLCSGEASSMTCDLVLWEAAAQYLFLG